MRRLVCCVSAVVLAGCAVAPGLAPLPTPRGPIVPGEVLVGWVAAPAAAAVAEAAAAVGGEPLETLGARTRLRVAPGRELEACRALRARQGVSVAEPNRLVRSRHVGRLRPARTLARAPGDPAWKATSPVPGQTATWGLERIRAEEAWDVGAGDPEVVIAVIDTGVDLAHPDLAPNLSAGARNFVESGQPPDDDFGHGTHVAGIAAAAADNGQGACGVAWRSKLLPIRVLGVDGTGTTWNTVQAIEYAVEREARVINMSLGSADYSTLEAEAIARATAAGSLVVAAAGNEATDGNYLEYPASYPGVVSVGAIGPDEKRASFSNFNSWVTIAAPGVDIFSTIPSRMVPAAAGQAAAPAYGYLSGTSMAAPFVSGAAALLFARNPGWSPAQVTTQLKRAARELTPAGDQIQGYDVFFGAGLLDVGRAMGR